MAVEVAVDPPGCCGQEEYLCCASCMSKAGSNPGSLCARFSSEEKMNWL